MGSVPHSEHYLLVFDEPNGPFEERRELELAVSPQQV